MFRRLLNLLGWNTSDAPIKPEPMKAARHINTFQALIDKHAGKKKPDAREAADIELVKSYELVYAPLMPEEKLGIHFINTLSNIVTNVPANQIAPTAPDTIPTTTSQKKDFSHLKPTDAPLASRLGLSQVLSQLKHGHFKQPNAPEVERMEEPVAFHIVQGEFAPTAPTL